MSNCLLDQRTPISAGLQGVSVMSMGVLCLTGASGRSSLPARRCWREVRCLSRNSLSLRSMSFMFSSIFFSLLESKGRKKQRGE